MTSDDGIVKKFPMTSDDGIVKKQEKNDGFLPTACLSLKRLISFELPLGLVTHQRLKFCSSMFPGRDGAHGGHL